jgi:phosphoenolpyruvate synthase/pyruvate phosphate dikinase
MPQQVFGNLDAQSGTGVAFTRNPATGENAVFGEFLSCAVGDEVVDSGTRYPKSLTVSTVTVHTHIFIIISLEHILYPAFLHSDNTESQH